MGTRLAAHRHMPDDFRRQMLRRPCRSVLTLVAWWLRHPDRSAAEMTVRGGRALTALSRTTVPHEGKTR